MQPSPIAETSRLLFPSLRFCIVSPCILVSVVKCGHGGRGRPMSPWSLQRPSESQGRRAHLPEEPEQLPGPSSEEPKGPHPLGWATNWKENRSGEFSKRLRGGRCL